MTRGDIVYVHNDMNKATGSEWSKDRPAIVVSNNMCNKHSPVVEVVYTTTARRKYLLPTHTIVHSTPLKSVALCEAIYSVDKCRILETIGHCSTEEMNAINRALKISLDLIGGGGYKYETKN